MLIFCLSHFHIQRELFNLPCVHSCTVAFLASLKWGEAANRAAASDESATVGRNETEEPRETGQSLQSFHRFQLDETDVMLLLWLLSRFMSWRRRSWSWRVWVSLRSGRSACSICRQVESSRTYRVSRRNSTENETSRWTLSTRLKTSKLRWSVRPAHFHSPYLYSNVIVMGLDYWDRVIFELNDSAHSDSTTAHCHRR